MKYTEYSVGLSYKVKRYVYVLVREDLITTELIRLVY